MGNGGRSWEIYRRTVRLSPVAHNDRVCINRYGLSVRNPYLHILLRTLISSYIRVPGIAFVGLREIVGLAISQHPIPKCIF